MKLLGKEIEIGMNCLNMIHIEDYYYKVKKFFDRVLLGENFSMIEEFKNRESSSSFWKSFWSPRHNSDGDVIGITCFSQDVTEVVSLGVNIGNHKKTKSDLIMEKKVLDATLESVGEGVISCDILGNITFLNRVAEILTGWKLHEAKGRSIEEVFNIINESTRKKGINIVRKAIEDHKKIKYRNHILLISKDGIERPIEDSAIPIVTDDTSILGVVLVFKDCTSMKKNLGQIKYLSHRDQLTGLYNRRYYEEELKRLDAKEFLPLTIVMGDINGLKLVNDTFGHSVGDKLLKKTANILKEICKAEDVISRFGGDEFVILLANTNESQAYKLISKIKKESLKDKVEDLDFSISFGYATKNNMDEDILKIFKNAEDYMNKNKLYESWSMRSGTIEMLMNSLYEKSDREMLHSKRVGAISSAIAKELGLKEDIVKNLGLAGLMHDIGKIGINESILNKDGKLTDCEWKDIQKHPEIGYRILNSVNEFSDIANYILEHHERWDGKGYPRGLKAKEISICGRIIAIADAYDAMTNNRAYRVRMNKEEALIEIRRCSGSQFDPEIVKVFLEQVADEIE